MTTLSVPLKSDLVDFIDSMISNNKAETKAEVVRMALRRMEESEAIERVLRSEQDFREGKFSDADLRKTIRG